MASQQEKEPPLLSQRHRIRLVVLACLQNSLVGGLVYGWASIDRTLLAAPASKGGAGLLHQETTTIFSWASSVAMLSTLVLGIFLDRFGPRICSVVSNLAVCIGCQLFALADDFGNFCFATCLMSFGGPGIQISIVHLANLFPDNQYFVLCCLNGTISISFAVLAIFDYLWEKYASLNFRTLFGTYSLVIIASAIISAVYWPDKPYEPPLDDLDLILEPTPEEAYIEASTAHPHLLEQPLDSYLRKDPSHRLERHESYLISKEAIESGNGSLISPKDQPFRRQLRSSTYIRALFVFIILCFLANFYIASISTEASVCIVGVKSHFDQQTYSFSFCSQMADARNFSDKEQHDLAVIFTFIMSAGIFASLIVGWLMDRIGIDACTALTLFLGLVQILVLIFVPDKRGWMIFGFVVYVHFRQFLFPVYIASLTSRLGFKYFGLLNGLGFAVSGIAQAFMSSLVTAVQGDCHLVPNDETHRDIECDLGRWAQLHLVQFVVMCGLMFAPFLEHVEEARRKQRAKQLLGSKASLNKYGSLLSVEERAAPNESDPIGMEL